jgi:hypothetical protein
MASTGAGCGVLRRRAIPAILLSLVAWMSSLAAAQGAHAAVQGISLATAAGNHSCAIERGKAYCWGDNYSGDLGDGGTAPSGVPVAVDSAGVLAGKTITHLAAGEYGTCALDSAGAAYCWGTNFAGQLGDGITAASSAVPVAVDASGVLAGKTLSSISAGYGHTCAADTAGAAYCWGLGSSGQLGDNGGSTVVPVLVGLDAPADVSALTGDDAVTVSWSAPASLDGGILTGYTATAAPGGSACTTAGATTCIITGLTAGTTYSITVVAHTTAGDSGPS